MGGNGRVGTHRRTPSVEKAATVTDHDTYAPLRARVREFCKDFPDEYWRELDRTRSYPEAFTRAMTETGLLGALIPAEYGGLGMSLTEASVILEEVNYSGGNAGPAHAQMYVMGTLLRHG